MHKEKIKTESKVVDRLTTVTNDFKSFAEYSLSKAFAGNDTELITDTLDRMFFNCLSSDDFDSRDRDYVIVTYLSLKKLVQGLDNGDIDFSNRVSIKDPYES